MGVETNKWLKQIFLHRLAACAKLRSGRSGVAMTLTFKAVRGGSL